MPDWKKLVRERLGSLHLPPVIQDEVVQELAAHLDDGYEEKLAAGMNPSQAMESSLEEVDHWRPLARKIEHSKQESVMNTRSKQFWFPALISLATSMIWLMVIGIAADKLHLEWKYANMAFLPYTVWILTLPLIGGISGRLSCRAGSSRSARRLAVVFPALVMLLLWLAIVISLLAHKSPHAIPALGYGVMAWVVVPGIALLLGTVPLSRREKASA